MLNKRFKIAKCKTSLKLATSRIKLMRNKKGVQINQMKQELAQLLESGQDRAARIRVEHVIREEKMVAAYDLIEIYCELIVARLPIIESQKTCPIDLKEAVTSIIFAAPRCSDIPELADAKKNFTAKYGKEFASAAIELRPDCGVSRMLVEKLSAVAPDVQTKVKVLSAVAKEHNINWDATSFEEKESKPPDDLLNGPTYFEKASTISVESPKIQTSNVQNVQTHEVNPNQHFDFAQQNRRFTLDAQNVTTTDAHDDMRASGMMNTSQSFHRNNSNSSFGGENWNLEFKDATSAAQAAAESAERASFAARAAARLSSQGKITRQYSTESYSSEQQKPQVSSEYTGQHNFKDSYHNTSFNDRNSKIQNQQMGPTVTDTFPKATKKSSSLRSRNDPEINHFETYESSSKSTNADYYGEEVIKKQPGITPSRTHSTTVSQKKVVDHKNVVSDATKYDDAHTDDESDSDNEPWFDTGFEYDEGEAKLFFPSPGREPSPKKRTDNTMGRVGSAKSADHSVKYDLSDGPDSETEAEMKKLIFSPTKNSTSRVDPTYVESPGKVKPTKSRIELDDLVETSSSFQNEYVTTKSCFSGTKKSTSGADPAYVESPRKVQPTKSWVELNDLVETGSLFHNEYETTKSSFSPKKKSTPRADPAYVESPQKVKSTKSRVELNDLVETGSSFHNKSDDVDTGKDLIFGTLTGGLRNKGGLKYPPYMKTAVEEGPVKVDTMPKRSSFNSRASSLDNKKPSVSVSSSESDSDDHNATVRITKSFKTRSQFAPPDKFFGNDEPDSEEEVPSVSKQTSTGKVHLGPGLSRRTKGQVEPVGKTVISNPSTSENLKKNHEALETSSTSAAQKTNTRSNITKSPPEPRPDPARFNQEPYRTKPDYETSKSSPNTTKKIVESRKIEEPKTLSLNPETKLEENNVKKPSHVHPKLPEYDSLAARIQALSKMHHR